MPTDPPASSAPPPAPPHSTPGNQALLEESNRLLQLCNRMTAERAREYKYRFSQSIVFGLPVIALQFYGRSLGPTDWQRWVSLLQLLLVGWVLYVNLGMLIEGIAWLWWRRWSWDLPVISFAGLAYCYSALAACVGIIAGGLPYRPLFDACIVLLAAWTGWRWMRLAGA